MSSATVLEIELICIIQIFNKAHQYDKYNPTRINIALKDLVEFAPILDLKRNMNINSPCAYNFAVYFSMCKTIAHCQWCDSESSGTAQCQEYSKCKGTGRYLEICIIYGSIPQPIVGLCASENQLNSIKYRISLSI